MHITKMWAENTSTINSLKITCLCLSLGTLVSSVLLFTFAQRPPLLIERSCHSQVLESAPLGNTVKETKAFLLEALPARFDTLAVKPHLLTVNELKRRILEQKRFSKQKMVQKMIVDKVEITDEANLVYATRLISVKNIRSALPFAMKIELKKTRRTIENPYGLVISGVKEVVSESNSKSSKKEGQ